MAEEKKQSSWKGTAGFVAGSITTTVIGDVNGWFLSRKFPVIISIAGFQFSIGFSLLFTLIILVVMGVAFYVGFINAFAKFEQVMFPWIKVPLFFRIISFLSYPVFWLFSGTLIRWQKRERSKVRAEIEKMQKEMDEEGTEDAK